MYHQVGNFPSVQLFQYGLLLLVEGVTGQYQDSQVDGPDYFTGSGHTFPAQLTGIVRTGRVYHDHGTQIGDLDGFFDRVGGGSRFFRNNGHLLVCQAVDQGGFPVIPASEDPDMWFGITSLHKTSRISFTVNPFFRS